MKLTTLTLIALASTFTACEEKKADTSTEQKAEPQVVSNSKVEQKVEAEPECCKHHEKLAADAVVTDESIYQLDSTWKNSEGKEQKLKSLGGHIQVVTMGYTTCKYACPRLLADMLLIESKLPEAIRKKVHFTFISIDPKRDTPARLTEYLKENKLTSKRWTVLTGNASAVQELAVVLGVKYRKISDIDFAHSNLITVLNEKGEIIHRQQGLGIDPTLTVEAIKGL